MLEIDRVRKLGLVQAKLESLFHKLETLENLETGYCSVEAQQWAVMLLTDDIALLEIEERKLLCPGKLRKKW